MKFHVHTALFCTALIAGAMLAFSPVYAQQSTAAKTQGSSGGGKPGVAHQEFGPQVVAKRRDRMGVVGNSNPGGSAHGNSATSQPAQRSRARMPNTRRSQHSPSSHSAHSPSTQSSSK